jgi:hypothetical protein
MKTEKKPTKHAPELEHKKQRLKEASDLALVQLQDELETSKHNTETLIRNTLLIAGGLTLAYMAVRIITAKGPSEKKGKKNKRLSAEFPVREQVHLSPPAQAAVAVSAKAMPAPSGPGIYQRLGNEVLMIALGVLKDRLIEYLKKQLNDQPAGTKQAS